MNRQILPPIEKHIPHDETGMGLQSVLKNMTIKKNAHSLGKNHMVEDDGFA